ncbi:ras guanine nucleotide exchange factor domain-containing protein [Fennellomyces sp. T-0311]|nr:ras guanine nucleotide exchange factor domain-containing protein [Fennellomyces sp. T-0311]
MTYLSAAEHSLQSLHDIKFVHSSIVSQPKQYAALISAMHSCLSHIEVILETHSMNRISSASEPVHHAKAPPPPLPPKPSRIQKPSIPPKPTLASRPTSPSKEQHSDIHQQQDNVATAADHYVAPPRPSFHLEPPRSTPSPDAHLPRPVSAPQPYNAPADNRRRPYSEYPSTDQSAAAIAADDGEVDPTHLIPAQTNAGDSLSPPTATTLNTDHVPFIPAPPLLTTHRVLQARLDELEMTIKEHKAEKQQHRGTREEEELDRVILQYTGLAADVKQTLNRVRTLYMSAATIPTVLQFPAHMLAYQITLIESAIFCAIPPKALLEHSARHPHPRIVASTDFFNYLTRVIEHGILLPQEASSRAQHINHWVKVASKCLDLNNYQTLKAIVSALGTPPVQRLRRTWAYIPKKSLTKLEALNELMSESDNYGKYREHMGMISTSIVNGRSVATIRAEHYAKPTVPFLGTFIHDITYLMAAAKSANQQPTNDPRVMEVLQNMDTFQKGPQFTVTPPSWFVKASQKHHLRPSLSNALHRSATGIGRFSGGMFGISSQNGGSDDDSTKDTVMEEDAGEEQQQMITQYILMRSWVSQNTVDELSMLREPPRQQARAGNNYQHRSTSGSNPHSSSMISNTSSLMRFSTGSVSVPSGGAESRGTSMEEYSPEYAPTSRSSSSARSSDDQDAAKNGGFWPFRRSTDSHRDVPQTPTRPIRKSVPSSNLDIMLTAEPPNIPPRPPPRKDDINDDEFKNDLTQRLQAQVAARHQ